jgi:serine/threonine protein kinase
MTPSAVGAGGAALLPCRHGVIHRDIKPANILLLDGKPVISDFGIALAVTSGGAARLTETGLSLGTPHYMSPEQATGDQTVGPATDIWALGSVLYEMLAGEPPYTGGTPQAVLGKIITAASPSALEARKSVPANVDAAIRKKLEKVPADRFASAGEFARALGDRRFRHAPATLEQGPVRSPAWIVTAAVAALLVVGGLFWSRSRVAPSDGSGVSGSLAVLPFENRSDNPEEYFSDGFADQLINALMTIPDLRVINRASIFASRDSGLDPRGIADTLGWPTSSPGPSSKRAAAYSCRPNSSTLSRGSTCGRIRSTGH